MKNEKIAKELLKIAREITGNNNDTELLDFGKSLVKWFKSNGARNVDVDFDGGDNGQFYDIDLGEGWSGADVGLQLEDSGYNFSVVLTVDEWDDILIKDKVPALREVQKMIDNAARDDRRRMILESVGAIKKR